MTNLDQMKLRLIAYKVYDENSDGIKRYDDDYKMSKVIQVTGIFLKTTAII